MGRIKMKKRIIIILLVVLLIFPFAWFVSIINCEVLTFLHGDEFWEGYEATNMLDKIDYLKVLDYSNTKARVYYVGMGRSSGDVIRFEKNNNKWEIDEWDTVWSSTGSADAVIWPYVYDSVEGKLLMITIGVPLFIIIITLFINFKKL